MKLILLSTLAALLGCNIATPGAPYDISCENGVIITVINGDEKCPEASSTTEMPDPTDGGNGSSTNAAGGSTSTTDSSTGSSGGSTSNGDSTGSDSANGSSSGDSTSDATSSSGGSSGDSSGGDSTSSSGGGLVDEIQK